MNLTTIILLVLALYLVQLFLQETARYGWNVRAIVGNRDQPPPCSVVAARLERAKNNLMEALPFFLGLALLAEAKGIDGGAVAHAATVFLVARVCYVPAYVSGLPWLRSLIWLTAIGALAAMALALLP